MTAALVVTLALVTRTDLRRRVIPNPILAASAAICLALAATDPSGLPERAAGAAAAGGLLLLAALVDPRGMGMGDVKLAALIGFYLGSSVVPAMLVALASGSVAGTALIVARGAGARRQTIPFGPFLALGAVVGLLAGNRVCDWYLTSL